MNQQNKTAPGSECGVYNKFTFDGRLCFLSSADSSVCSPQCFIINNVVFLWSLLNTNVKLQKWLFHFSSIKHCYEIIPSKPKMGKNTFWLTLLRNSSPLTYFLGIALRYNQSLFVLVEKFPLTRFVLLPLGAADSRGELGVTGEAVTGAVSLSPVVRVAAVPHTFPAAGSRQGQWGTLGI